MAPIRQPKSSDGGNDTGNKKVVWSYLDNADRAALKDTYAKLNGIRKSVPALFSNASEAVLSCKTSGSSWTAPFNMRLINGASELYCVINPAVSGEMSIEVPFSKAPSSYNLILSSYEVNPSLTGNKVTLPAGAFAIFGTADVSGIDDVIVEEPAVNTVLGGFGSITVLGDYSLLDVYTLTGRVVNRTEGLVPGIYVVRVDGQTFKVQVK